MTLILLAATIAGLLALAAWWVRRTNLAVAPAGTPARLRRPLPTGCDLGEKLMMAAVSTDSATGVGAKSTGGGDAQPVAPSPPAKPKPPKRKKISGPSRREFLRNTWLLSWLGVGGAFAGASVGFLWPTLRGGFGAQITLPESEEEILALINETREPYAYTSGRMYLVAYDASLDAEGIYTDITADGGSGLMALYQRCVHLGCRVPWCISSQWFECPCHGSKYNRWGEYQQGPAPRGLDRFSLTVEDGVVTVDTATIITGPTRTGDVLDQPAEGPNCT